MALKLNAWNPLPGSTYWTGWQGAIAHVWAWSALADSDASTAENSVPESAVQAAPSQDGFRLLRCLEGFEGQFWSRGVLQASRWWASIPEETAWQQFQRSAGEPPSGRPQPETPEWIARAWARSADAGQAWLLRNEGRMVLGVAVLLALAMGWQLASLWKTSWAVSSAQSRLVQLQEQAAPQLEIRDRALADRDMIERLRRLEPPFEILPLMATLAHVQPEAAEVREWQVEGDLLRIVLEGEELDPGTVVRAFESIDHLSDVLAERERGAGRIAVNARLRGASP